MNSFKQQLDKALLGLDISSQVRETHLGPGLPSPRDVLSFIESLNVPFVMIGAHGIFQYTGKPRGTIDIDLIIGRNFKRVVNAIKAKWPDLEVRDYPYKTSFAMGENEVIDLVKPTQQLYKLALNNRSGNIPSLEMALVLKFSAIVSPHRGEHEKLQDVTDFKIMVLKNKPINVAKVQQLIGMAGLHPEAGNEVTGLIRDIEQGRRTTI